MLSFKIWAVFATGGSFMLGWLQRLAYAFVIAGLLAACADKPGKEEEEAAKNTFVCLFEGERLVIRFDAGTARLLLPTGDKVALYQIPAASGVRFSNGSLELRGKGTDLTLIDLNTATSTALAQCGPYTTPKH
jgi:membrane-bound inhibitor of C-type lysozyme